MKDNMRLANPITDVVLLGVLVFFTITAVSILHVSIPDFFSEKFPGLTDFEISLYDTVLYSSYLIVGILTGLFSDRIGRRKIFVVIGSGASGLFFYLLTVAPNYTLLLVLRFCQGAFTVLTWQIIMTLILDISSPKNRGKNMGMFGIFLTLAMGLGSVIGGVLAKPGVFIPYYTSVALSVIVFIMSLLLLHEPKNLKKTPSLKKIILILKKHPKLSIPGIFNFIDRLHMGFIIFIVPFYLLEVLGLSVDLRGMVLGLYAFPLILLSYSMGKLSDVHGRYKPLIVGSLGFGIVLSIIGVLGTYGLAVMIGLFVVLGAFASLTTPPAMALVGDIIPAENIAIGMGAFNFLGNLGIILGPILAGLLMFNYPVAFLIAGLIELVFLGVCGFLIWYFEKN